MRSSILSPPDECPSCGGPGRAVSEATVFAHTGAENRPKARLSAWRFCRNRTCPVSYFAASEKSAVQLGALTSPFSKSSSPNRMLCFCFEHTAAQIAAAPSLQATIVAACRAGKAACELKNPEGRCCLGQVAAVIRSAAPDGCCPALPDAP